MICSKFKFFKGVLSLLLLTCAVSAFSQKLPSVQDSSLTAPALVKVDGKANEWNNEFQAFNTNTETFYTIANNDTHLYLIFQVASPAVIRRVINGGITITINKLGKKNKKDDVTVTYPVFAKNDPFRPSFVPYGRKLVITSPMRAGNGSTSQPVVPLSPTEADSLMNVNNRNFVLKSKSIKTSGIQNVDSLISVYNEDGIKATALFDNKLRYTYEIAIDLKHLGMSAINGGKFFYRVMINEVTASGYTISGNNAPGAAGVATVTYSSNAQSGQYATDFWAEYTIKKTVK